MTDQMLPAGVHPGDRTAPLQPGFDANVPVGGDVPGLINPRTNKPWNTDNADALGVYQRAAADWTPGLVVVNSNNSALVVGRQKGRLAVLLSVPTSVMINGTLTTTPAGVLIGSDPQEAASNLYVLNVGDSVAIYTEASVYAALVPGTSAGYVQFITLTNPLGGELGIY
jgi:hypothetical protein